MICDCPNCDQSVEWDWGDLGSARACPGCRKVFAVQYDEVYVPEIGEQYEYAYPREPDDIDERDGTWPPA
jgi:hypothetical protein